MAAYVMLTATLFRPGSAESRDPHDPYRPNDEVPAPVRKRSPVLSWFYAYSLGITLAVLFVSRSHCIGGMSYGREREGIGP